MKILYKNACFWIVLSALNESSSANMKNKKEGTNKIIRRASKGLCYVSYIKAQSRSMCFKHATDQINVLLSELKAVEQEAMLIQSNTGLSEVEKRQKMEGVQHKFAEGYQRVEEAKRLMEERKDMALKEFSIEVFALGYKKWFVLENPYENWNPEALNEEAHDLTDMFVKALDKAFKGFFIPKSKAPKGSKN